VLRESGWAVVVRGGEGSINFCLFPPRRPDGGPDSSDRSAGSEVRRLDAFRFLVDGDGAGTGWVESVEGVGVAASAASLAEERVTLRDMSNGSHQAKLK
jgi:hypothetical protein